VETVPDAPEAVIGRFWEMPPIVNLINTKEAGTPTGTAQADVWSLVWDGGGMRRRTSGLLAIVDPSRERLRFLFVSLCLRMRLIPIRRDGPLSSRQTR